MPMTEIPRREWATFLGGFAGQHEDWLVTIEVAADSRADFEVKARDLPLDGITLEVKNDGQTLISVTVGSGTEDEAMHTIVEPTSVRLQQTEEGADEALHIGSSKAVTTVRLQSPILPETVDGVLSKPRRLRVR
jgi:Family of unknown function (DUF5335)